MIEQDATLADLMIGLMSPGAAVDRLLHDHRDLDGRCATCRAGASTTARVIWPCTLYTSALAARRLQSPRPAR